MSEAPDRLQSLCAAGQEALERMDYRAAEARLVEAERLAAETGDFETLGRLYLPLQEARRQIRQRCGEGVVKLDLVQREPDRPLSAEQIVERYPAGQLLVAGWGSIEPAAAVRELARRRGLYLETYLAAVYPAGAGRAVVIVPLQDVQLPPVEPTLSIDRLLARVPAHSIVLNETELPPGERAGTAETYAHTMRIWERLHAPFLAEADAIADPVRRIEAYRRTIRVDAACELAHQKLSQTAREYARQLRRGGERGGRM